MHDTSIAAFCEWAQTREVGCMFARAMFRMPVDHGITFVRVTGLAGAELAQATTDRVTEQTADGTCQGTVIVFDSDLEPAGFEDLFDRIGSAPDWLLRSNTEEYQGKQYRVVGLDRYVGEDQGIRVLSEVVAFAPYSYLPRTRRAPVPAMVLRTKPAFSQNPLEGRSERRANLATIHFDIPQETFEVLSIKSHQLREELDGAGNPLARARVAFAFPLT